MTSYPFDLTDHETLELSKALMRKQHALSYQKEHGGSFSRAWNAVLLDHPEVASREELTPTDRPAFVASEGYRYTEDRKHLPPVGDLKTALKSFIPERVQAKSPKEKEVYLVYGSNGEVVDLKLR